MCNHLICCAYASKKAKSAAKKVKGSTKGKGDDTDNEGADEDDDNASSSFGNSPKKKIQQKLKVYRGVDIPFSMEHVMAIEEQTLKATLSANLPFRWIEDSEVIKLFELFRLAATTTLPSCRVLSGRLLTDASDTVELELEKRLRGKYVVLP